MKYIGNYEHWIKQEWIDYMKETDGFGYPRDLCERVTESGIIKSIVDSEWDMSCVCCVAYEARNFPFTIDSLPMDTTGWDYEWWFLKLKPGMGQPWHKDYLMDGKYKETKRYWMALQDYEPGHLFIYEDRVLIDYKKGDLYEYTDVNVYHTSTCLGRRTRLTLNMTLYR
jgi:hypothetical protein